MSSRIGVGTRARVALAALAALLALALAPGAASATESSGSIVRISRGPAGFLYTVNAMPEPIRGMGYNARLASRSAEERAVLFDRDFALMRRVGVNTVLGWDQGGFDGQLLDAAAAHGLGVIMHFELGKGWDYSDPALRERLHLEIAEWVRTYSRHPAVRMWGIGNEVLLVTPDHESAAFAEFWVEAYRVVTALDPNHPVIYREAEDVRARFFRDAFERAGVEPDAFVFGMNFYTPRLEEALASWAAGGLDVPILVSEFAPAGVGPSGRALGFRELWARVVSHEAQVLGAAPYAWTTEGPEAVDRIFGLTDAEGKPVDDALAQIQLLYRGANASSQPLPEPSSRPTFALAEGIASATSRLLARAIALPELDSIDVTSARNDARALYLDNLREMPAFAGADGERVDRVLSMLADTAVLAQLRRDGVPLYNGAVEALPLLAGITRWAAIEPRAEAVAQAFLGEVLAQELRAFGA